MTEDNMVGWQHWFYDYEFEQAPEVGNRQESQVYCRPWGLKESDMTKWLNNNMQFEGEKKSQYSQFEKEKPVLLKNVPDKAVQSLILLILTLEYLFL